MSSIKLFLLRGHPQFFSLIFRIKFVRWFLWCTLNHFLRGHLNWLHKYLQMVSSNLPALTLPVRISLVYVSIPRVQDQFYCRLLWWFWWRGWFLTYWVGESTFPTRERLNYEWITMSISQVIHQHNNLALLQMIANYLTILFLSGTIPNSQGYFLLIHIDNFLVKFDCNSWLYFAGW